MDVSVTLDWIHQFPSNAFVRSVCCSYAFLKENNDIQQSFDVKK